MSVEAYKAHIAKKLAKVPKFRNVKTEVLGIKFDSKKEGKRYQDLVLWQSSGQITELEHQRVFSIEVNGVHVCDYIADFSYRKNGVLVVEDVKSKITRKQPVYRLKNKLMTVVHGIEILEV